MKILSHSSTKATLIVRLTLAVLALFLTTDSFGQAPTPKQKQAVKQIKTNIDRAGKQFKANKFDASGQYINQAIAQMAAVSAKASPEVLELLKPEFTRLEKAHKLLSDAGQKLTAMQPLPQPTNGDAAAVSFVKSIAPIIVAKCGNCHVNQKRGDFSAATFLALDASTTLAYGLPNDARLIQVIESGEMPKNGAKVTPEELKLLRDWMQQGAKFDGDDPKKSLNEFATTPPPAQPRRNATVNLPTGKETVSFGLHVAPILLENCARCHITDRPRGNFSMASFREILRGGDGGTPIEAKKSGESQIIKRLRGDGVEIMPPSGKLDDKLIDTIAKWIDEGAAFDGGDSRLVTSMVVARSKAASQTHEELLADRGDLATRTWKLVMDSVQSKVLPSDNFLVTGSTNESRLTDISQLCEKMAPKIASALRANSKTPLVKGNTSVFVFAKRYDFSEFGKMIEKRDFPKDVSGHWGYNITDAYATVLMTRSQSAEDVQVALAHQIASLHVANLALDMPRWFADGLGLWTAKKIFSNEDAMKSLDMRAESAMAEMVKPDDFIQNRMPSDRAALVGYLFVKKLRSDSGSFARLMKSISKSHSFESSFKATYGKTPSEILGQKEPAKRR